MTTLTPEQKKKLATLQAAIDGYGAIYRKLRQASDLAKYLANKGSQADELILTGPVLRTIIERVLGFPPGSYLEQLGKSGKKPDFTPDDLLAHPFVFDSKSSDENLLKHEAQIRGYMTQRRLDFGILFNLREFRVLRAHATGFDEALSFHVLPLWQLARGEALPATELDRFMAFCQTFGHQTLTLEEKVVRIADQPSWSQRLKQEDLRVDVDDLVERLRRLSVRLAEDAGAIVIELDHLLDAEPSRERRLLEELQLLANDLAPGTGPAELPEKVKAWRSTEGLPAHSWRQYLLRVAYLALTRILLYRAWEDVQFVESYLHDGGFELWYERKHNDARKVLDEAFLHGYQQYPWLFGRENNYDWYHPREEALVDVLYALAPEPLGKLDADVLGALYETYVEAIDRDRLGQFFTPRSVVRFMLDRAGFREDRGDGVFRIEGDERKPKQVLDFATGSGGFLVEAARRIIDAVQPDEAKSLREALTAIVAGFTGGEISPFPYYLTEVNLLLQVSRLLGPLRAAEHHAVASFGALGVLPVDTLSAKSAAAASLDVKPELRSDLAELPDDDRIGLVPLTGEKRDVYRERLRQDGFFDLVVGNPPYVSEANNKPLFDRLRKIAAWKGIYRGKTDYLYYFLWLAVEKVKPGGRFCVITPAGWMNAGAAAFLREKLAGELRLDELFLFGSYRLFATESSAPTPTVESAILVATKTRARVTHKLRVVALEDESAAPADRDELLAELTRRARGKPGRKSGIHVHDVLQSELRPELPWAVKHAAGDLASRVVVHIERRQLDNEAGIEPLGAACRIFMGIETGADSYTPRIRKRLEPNVRSKIEAAGARLGDPILQLSPEVAGREPWSMNPDVLAKAPEPEAILYGAIDDADHVVFVRLERDARVPEPILKALDLWRPILSTRAEIARNTKRAWWETAWPRDSRDLDAAKVIGLHRTHRGRFALDEAGAWKPGKSAVVIVPRNDALSVAYLCGVLNSELLDLWYAVRGRHPRDIWRDYEPKPMARIPFCCRNADPRTLRIAELVREIAANRRSLLPHRPVVRDLERIVKDPWKDGPVEVDGAALVAELPASEKISVRLDPQLEAAFAEEGTGRPSREGSTALVFRRGKRELGRVTGDPRRLDLLEELLGGKAGDRAAETLLPRKLDAFEKKVRERADLVSALLAEGRRLVEEVEWLVCGLYGLPDELTNEVVRHAVERAVRSGR